MLINLQQGMTFADSGFVEDIILILGALFMIIGLPRFLPLYQSIYQMTETGIKITRFMKPRVEIPYEHIERAEVFIKKTPLISKDARTYLLDSTSNLRKSGFKLIDYTNNEDIIMNLFVAQKIYIISPFKPKTLLKDLKRKNNKLTAKIVELHERGKRIQELGK
jgi:hypothetical protein